MGNTAGFSEADSSTKEVHAGPRLAEHPAGFDDALFRQRLGEAFAFAVDHNIPVSLILVELHDPKPGTQALESRAGRLLLEHVDRVLRRSVRYEDPFMRCADQTFGLILRGADEVEAGVVADRIRGRVERASLELEGWRAPIAVSVGIATCKRGDFQRADQMIAAAQYRLGEAKTTGGDTP